MAMTWVLRGAFPRARGSHGYDALTAGDRPYKRGRPEAQALDILAVEAKAAKIDASLYKVFVESGAWRLKR